MKNHSKSADGKYHIKGSTYDILNGTRAQVWHKTAYKTSGGLKKSDLMMNKNGRIVSRIKHNTAKKEKRLEKAGYFTKKGVFGFVKKDGSKTKKRRSNKKQKGGFEPADATPYSPSWESVSSEQTGGKHKRKNKTLKR
jgi:hypothetical protein